MSWNLKTDRPIYLQLSNYLRLKIVSGCYPPGSKLPSVRELAAKASVSPNTMMKALDELEAEGLIHPHYLNSESFNYFFLCDKVSWFRF